MLNRQQLQQKMAEGNAWLRENATLVLVGIPGFRKRHGYTQADKDRMKAALGHDYCSVRTKEEEEESQRKAIGK